MNKRQRKLYEKKLKYKKYHNVKIVRKMIKSIILKDIKRKIWKFPVKSYTIIELEFDKENNLDMEENVCEMNW